MLKGFRDFLMRGDVIVIAVGLSVALAFSNLVKAFTDDIINPLIAAAQGNVKGPGLGWQLVSGGGDGTYLNLGALISAIHYFYDGRVFSDRRALQVRHASHGQDGVRRTSPNQDLPGLPLRRPEPRRNEVQALRRGYRQSRRLTKADFRPHVPSPGAPQRSDPADYDEREKAELGE